MSISEPGSPFGSEAGSTSGRGISENFCAGDADVTFMSSDNVAFRIHRKNLEVAAAGFPPAEFDTCGGEDVELTEDAATLELLFQYAYPQRHPNLADVPFYTLSRLAEAAEKYEVFSAMDICYWHMKNTLPDHAREIFDYASKHDHKELLVAVAPLLLDIPVDKMVKSIAAHLALPWVCYWSAWNRVVLQTIKAIPNIEQNTQHLCAQCSRYLPGCNLRPANILMGVGEARTKVSLQKAYTMYIKTWPCSHLACDALWAKMEEALDKVPAFDTFF